MCSAFSQRHFSKRIVDLIIDVLQRKRPESASVSSAKTRPLGSALNTNNSGSGCTFVSSTTLTGEEIRILRRAREEHSRRGGWVRIFPTASSWDSYRWWPCSPLVCVAPCPCICVLLHRLLTASEVPGLPTSVALSAQSLTIRAVLVSALPSAAICSFHEPEQLALRLMLLHHSSSCLELTAASQFTFTPHPSVTVCFGGLNTQLFRLAFHWLFLWEQLKRLNWTEWGNDRPLGN